MSNLKISIITVCFNCKDSIENTIKSVLGQSYGNIEYIIIDGGSKDGTVDIIKKYSDNLAYWISESDHGIYDAMNKGIEKATGDYINFMNAGDQFTNVDVIQQIVLQIHSDTCIAYGNWNIKLGNLKQPRTPLAWKYLSRQIPFCHQAAFYNTVYHKRHLFPANLKYVGDYKIVYDAYHIDNVIFQYIPIEVADYDITLGNSVSIDNFRQCLNEKYIVWNIVDNPIKKYPHEIELLFTRLSYAIKKRLSNDTIMKIKNLRNNFRKHKKK